jgi:hypothetical protein
MGGTTSVFMFYIIPEHLARVMILLLTSLLPSSVPLPVLNPSAVSLCYTPLPPLSCIASGLLPLAYPLLL